MPTWLDANSGRRLKSTPVGAGHGVNLRAVKNPLPHVDVMTNERNRRKLLSLIVSTVAYFVASYYIKRYLDGLEAPPGFTRNMLTFCAALLIAYGVAAAVEWAQS